LALYGERNAEHKNMPVILHHVHYFHFTALLHSLENQTRLEGFISLTYSSWKPMPLWVPGTQSTWNYCRELPYIWPSLFVEMKHRNTLKLSASSATSVVDHVMLMHVFFGWESHNYHKSIGRS
jgi:hypothetical protein